MKVLLRRDYHRGTGRLAACVALFADAPQSPDREIKIEMSLRLVISLSSLLCYFVLSPAFRALLGSRTVSDIRSIFSLFRDVSGNVIRVRTWKGKLSSMVLWSG